jgi:uncharacterized membrane protein YqgA involved in biofilm formation
MKGTLVNVATVLVGSAIGLAVGPRLPERIKNIIVSALGLVTFVIGLRMALKSESILIVIASMIAGGIVGELLDLEGKIEALGDYLRAKVGSTQGNFVTGFVTASLVYCVGPMTIVGSIQEGMNGRADVLYAKAMLDGAASVAFASSLGLGVAFSAVTVLLFQGALTLLGSQLAFLLEDRILNELIGTGGVMILGIGLILLDLKRLRVANYLPALVFAVLLALLFR